MFKETFSSFGGVDFIVRVVDEVATEVELNEVESHSEGPEVGVLSVAEAISSATKKGVH
jgi:hypothetical protein